jgi:hypothetical protein
MLRNILFKTPKLQLWVMPCGYRYKRCRLLLMDPLLLVFREKLYQALLCLGVGVTGVFISVLAAGLTRSRRRQKDNNSLGYDTKQTIKGHIDKLEQLSEEDVHVLLSMIKSLHDSLKKSKSNL